MRSYELPRTFEDLLRLLREEPPKDGDLERNDILEWAREADAFLAGGGSLDDISVSTLAEWLADEYDRLHDEHAMEKLCDALAEAGCGGP